jgi:predicted DNA binding protein
MKRAKIVYSHPEGFFQSIGSALADHAAVNPVALHSARLLTDGTGVLLYELEGDADAVRDLLDGNERTTRFDVTHMRECIAAYVHFSPTETVERLLELQERYGLVIDPPMPIHDDGALEVTVISPQENISEAFAEIPDMVELTVERVETHTPIEGNYFETLSDRQREVLQLAYERGYYEEPRNATHEDLASELDCSKANLGEILRRIENNLVEHVLKQANSSSRTSSPFDSSE